MDLNNLSFAPERERLLKLIEGTYSRGAHDSGDAAMGFTILIGVVSMMLAMSWAWKGHPEAPWWVFTGMLLFLSWMAIGISRQLMKSLREYPVEIVLSERLVSYRFSNGRLVEFSWDHIHHVNYQDFGPYEEPINVYLCVNLSTGTEYLFLPYWVPRHSKICNYERAFKGFQPWFKDKA